MMHRYIDSRRAYKSTNVLDIQAYRNLGHDFEHQRPVKQGWRDGWIVPVAFLLGLLLLVAVILHYAEWLDAL